MDRKMAKSKKTPDKKIFCQPSFSFPFSGSFFTRIKFCYSAINTDLKNKKDLVKLVKFLFSANTLVVLVQITWGNSTVVTILTHTFKKSEIR